MPWWSLALKNNRCWYLTQLLRMRLSLSLRANFWLLGGTGTIDRPHSSPSRRTNRTDTTSLLSSLVERVGSTGDADGALHHATQMPYITSIAQMGKRTRDTVGCACSCACLPCAADASLTSFCCLASAAMVRYLPDATAPAGDTADERHCHSSHTGRERGHKYTGNVLPTAAPWRLSVCGRKCYAASPQWLFDRFRLDPDHACLWCEAQAIALPPKAFALHYLVTHPDRLVPKDELLDAVWPETAVSDAVMRVAIVCCARRWTTRPRRPASLPRSPAAAIASWRPSP